MWSLPLYVSPWQIRCRGFTAYLRSGCIIVALPIWDDAVSDDDLTLYCDTCHACHGQSSQCVTCNTWDPCHHHDVTLDTSWSPGQLIIGGYWTHVCSYRHTDSMARSISPYNISVEKWFPNSFLMVFFADHGCFQIDRKTNAYELNQHFYVVELKSNTDKI